MATKALIKRPSLKSWTALNSALLTATEKECEALLKEELAGRARRMFALRIHSRFNKQRYQRERAELNAKVAD